MAYREIRVRPVVRYIVTEFNSDEQGSASSETWGEFDNVDRANVIAHMLAHDEPTRHGEVPAKVTEAPYMRFRYNGTEWCATKQKLD